MEVRAQAGVLKLTVIASALVSLAVSASPSQAAKGRRGGGAPSGGIMLQTPDPRTPVEHNNRAVELGSKGLWPQAIHHHEEALRADPNNKEFRTNLSAAQLRYGELLAAKRDWYNAIKQFRGALYVDPSNAPADSNLENCLRHIGKNPDDWHARQKMAEDADTSGDYETAIVEYRKVIKMKDDGPSHYDLGRVLIKAGKVVDGFNELKIAVGKTWEKKDSQYLADCHRMLGDILKEYAFIAKSSGRGSTGMKRLLNAGIEYRRAVTINPANMDAARGLIECAREAAAINPSFDNQLTLAAGYQLTGDFERAKMAYEDCWRANPTSTVLPNARKSFYLAVAKHPTTPPAVMMTTLQKVQDALQKTPNDAELWYVLGKIKDRQGAREEAIEAYNRAVAINPYINPDLQQSLKLLGAGGAEPPAADGAGRTAKQAKPQPKDDTAKNLLAYADVEKQIRGGEIDAAQAKLMSMVEKNPKDGRAWLLLGNTHEKKGDLDQAVVAYRQASYLKETDADSALRTINTSRVQPMLKDAEEAVKENNWVKAAASYREALSIAPNLPIIHRKLAEALRQLGDTKEADRELKKATELEK